MTARTKTATYLSPLLCIVGIFFLAGGIFPLFDLLQIIQSPKIVTAVVVERVPHSPGLLPSHNRVLFQYWLDEEQYELQYNVNDEVFENLVPGNTVQLVVDEENPGNGRYEEGENFSVGIQMMPIFLGVMALYFAMKTAKTGKR